MQSETQDSLSDVDAKIIYNHLYVKKVWVIKVNQNLS